MVAVFLFLGVCGATLTTSANANAFLKAKAHHHEDRISAEELQTSLLAEVEGTFGEGSATSRVKQFEQTLAPLYAALPKNENGYLGHTTVRYALHRLFVQRHGWVVKGLDGSFSDNATLSAGLLKENVPAYIQELVEKQLGGRGMGLHDLAVLASTTEHLIHDEAIKRVGGAFQAQGVLPTETLNETIADELLNMYMATYILGEDLSNISSQEALALLADMSEVYMAWNETKKFVQMVRQEVVHSDASAEQKASGNLDFSLVARIAERVSEQFGRFQDRDCKVMKNDLVRMGGDIAKAGRVRLSDFYKPALDGQWQFQETAPYLRQLGALDESDPERPRVIIANYIASQTNCIGASSFYSICCIDECEGLLGHIENQIAAPEVTPSQLIDIVSKLSSSSVSSPRDISTELKDRLQDIASHHGGTVPLHGRLFAQWMHHAYPLECQFPHLSGTTFSHTADEWLEMTGQDASATSEDMLVHVEKASRLGASQEEATLPWAHEEELLVVRPPPANQAEASSMVGNIRNMVVFAAMGLAAYSLVQQSMQPKSGKAAVFAEKLLV